MCINIIGGRIVNKNFKGRDFTTVLDFSREELYYVLDYAKDLKLKRMAGEPVSIFEGKVLALIFEKPSLRTRVSFEVAMKELGGDTIYLSPQDIGLGKRESVKDTAEVLARYVSAIMVRTFSHKIVEDLAKYANIPIINGLSDTYHPCQAMGDMLTIKERKDRLNGLNIAFIGDGNNVANSLMLLSSRLGANFRIASPKGYEIKNEILDLAKKEIEINGGNILITNDPKEAVKNADVIYTDVWASMGQESEKEERKNIFQAYQVNMDLVKLAKNDVIIMHCLPAHRGEEITDEVVDSPYSVVIQQAENRLHAQKAILALVV